MLVFGIDPGSRRTGYGLVRAEGSRFVFVDSGVITLDADLDLSARLAILHEALARTFAATRPSHVFLESLFQHKNVRSAIVLAHARGVALLSAALSGATLGELAPAEVKQAVTGNGRAEKTQVAEMVGALLGRPKPFAADEADALAIAIAGGLRLRAPVATPARGRRRSRFTEADVEALLARTRAPADPPRPRARTSKP